MRDMLSPFFSGWFAIVIESLPQALVSYCLVWWGVFASARRRLKEASRHPRKLDAVLGVAAGAVITGTLRFATDVLLGAEAEQHMGGAFAVFLLLIVPGTSAVVFCWRTYLLAPLIDPAYSERQQCR